jgi:hypothetical protein
VFGTKEKLLAIAAYENTVHHRTEQALESLEVVNETKLVWRQLIEATGEALTTGNVIALKEAHNRLRELAANNSKSWSELEIAFESLRARRKRIGGGEDVEAKKRKPGRPKAQPKATQGQKTMDEFFH